MPSIINAAVGGVILSTDTSGALNIQAGGVNAIQISAAANVTVTNLVATSVTLTNAIAVSQGGTGQTTYTNGQLLIGNTTGNTLTKATLTAGSGITITNGAGAITITNSSTGGAQDFIVQSYGLV
jgi:hypothetical protein